MECRDLLRSTIRPSLTDLSCVLIAFNGRGSPNGLQQQQHNATKILAFGGVGTNDQINPSLLRRLCNPSRLLWVVWANATWLQRRGGRSRRADRVALGLGRTLTVARIPESPDPLSLQSALPSVSSTLHWEGLFPVAPPTCLAGSLAPSKVIVPNAIMQYYREPHFESGTHIAHGCGQQHGSRV